MVTQEDVKRLFGYDGNNLIWKEKAGTRAGVGDIAGSTGCHHYRRIRISGDCYYAHRLVWLWHYGVWPKNDIDHINGDRLDNRIENLRDVDRGENIRNSKIRTNNTSGNQGVHWRGDCGKWVSKITKNRKTIYLGLFSDKGAAIKARKQAEIKYGFHENHGRAA